MRLNSLIECNRDRLGRKEGRREGGRESMNDLVGKDLSRSATC